MKSETIIISVGGSLICPDGVNINFLKKFKEIIMHHVEKGMRFVLITGGGKICRDYQSAAKHLGKLSDEDLDWLGIDATRLNAHLFKAIFKQHVYPKVITDPTIKIKFTQKMLIAAGWKPGCSTDYVAVLLAKQFKVKKIINLTNIHFVYDKDPYRFGDARPFKDMKWKEYRKLVGDEWNPGLNAPFDPVASKEAEKNKMKVYIVNGLTIENLNQVIEGKEFVGTTIS
jgi:uridylate kinase